MARHCTVMKTWKHNSEKEIFHKFKFGSKLSTVPTLFCLKLNPFVCPPLPQLNRFLGKQNKLHELTTLSNIFFVSSGPTKSSWDSTWKQKKHSKKKNIKSKMRNFIISRKLIQLKHEYHLRDKACDATNRSLERVFQPPQEACRSLFACRHSSPFERSHQIFAFRIFEFKANVERKENLFISFNHIESNHAHTMYRRFVVSNRDRNKHISLEQRKLENDISKIKQPNTFHTWRSESS